MYPLNVSYSYSSSISAESDWISSSSSLASWITSSYSLESYSSNSSFRLPNLGNENPLEEDLVGREGIEVDGFRGGLVGGLDGREGDEADGLKGGLDGVLGGLDGVAVGL